MTNKLPVNLNALLRQRRVEGDRIEYKAGWNPDAIIRTLCAFANDFENLGGGYVVIGQDCNEDGTAIFPPVGLQENQLDLIQRELLQYCQMIQPTYFPVLSVEQVEGRHLIVLWAPGGLNRPYKAPRAVTAKHKEYHYFIRRYSSTVELKSNSEDEQELLRLTAAVPFDDRQCQRADVDDLRLPMIRLYLKEVGSDLAGQTSQMPFVDLCRQMNIVDGADEFLKPRNVGLLFFHEDPTRFMPGSQIEVVIFPTGPGGDELIEKTFLGPIHEQIREALRYIENRAVREKVIKHQGRAEASRFVSYPMNAIEEALVNAMYHRGYDQREPVEVRINPDGIEIVSYPGPDPSIRLESLNVGKIIARRYRNRRIGEFLKELDLTEGRCTGIPKIRAAMERNGSPEPRFSTDDGRTHFLVELPVHPEFAGMLEYAEPDVELTEAEFGILRFLSGGPRSRMDIAEFLGIERRSGSIARALVTLLANELAELTIPEKPTSRNQEYRITEKGRDYAERH
ncbi:MAG: putative DNA binding domain-containing protein [Planctomycetales bacterium]|nr:putative DNA binding domain-containing protein [Planctomycetales bacterium]